MFRNVNKNSETYFSVLVSRLRNVTTRNDFPKTRNGFPTGRGFPTEISLLSGKRFLTGICFQLGKVFPELGMVSQNSEWFPDWERFPNWDIFTIWEKIPDWEMVTTLERFPNWEMFHKWESFPIGKGFPVKISSFNGESTTTCSELKMGKLFPKPSKKINFSPLK